MSRTQLYTSESVTEGHPDKVADQISDALLDEILRGDPAAHCAIETLITTGLVVVAGELSTGARIDVPEVVRGVLRDIGYDHADRGYDGNNCGIIVTLDRQSPDIAQGLTESWESRSTGGDVTLLDRQGAGDQGMMIGYACDETPELMPLPIALAHRLSRRLSEARKTGLLPYLRPDGKTQVTVRYENGRPSRVTTIVVSAQHDPRADLEGVLVPEIRRHVVSACLPDEVREHAPTILVNPTGRFEIGGPVADVGLTGRKIIVDTYGGLARHGGGAFSGKDPSKVDRSAAYAARWVAKNVVAAGLATHCEVHLSYAIGVARPIGVHVETFGTERVDPARLAKVVPDFFDLRPAAIIRDLELTRPVYRRTAAYGHFGREEPGFTWERGTRAAELAAALA